MLKVNLLMLVLLSFCQHSLAYMTTLESGHIEPVGTHRAGLMGQIRLTEGSGANVGGTFDSSLNETSSMRVQVGGGETPFFSSLSYKWIPIPDYENQPAIGLKLEGLYGKLKDDTSLALRAHPLISKNFITDRGNFNPYFALPLSYISYKSSSETTTQLVFGSEYMTDNAENFVFTFELGISGAKSFNYVAGLVTFTFKDTRTKKTYY